MTSLSISVCPRILVAIMFPHGVPHFHPNRKLSKNENVTNPVGIIFHSTIVFVCFLVFNTYNLKEGVLVPQSKPSQDGFIDSQPSQW